MLTFPSNLWITVGDRNVILCIVVSLCFTLIIFNDSIWFRYILILKVPNASWTVQCINDHGQSLNKWWQSFYRAYKSRYQLQGIPQHGIIVWYDIKRTSRFTRMLHCKFSCWDRCLEIWMTFAVGYRCDNWANGRVAVLPVLCSLAATIKASVLHQFEIIGNEGADHHRTMEIIGHFNCSQPSYNRRWCNRWLKINANQRWLDYSRVRYS